MPIAAAQPLLESQIKAALSLGPGANVATTGSTIATAIGAAVSMGIFPTGPVPIPLAPSGLSAGDALIKASFSLGPAATIDTTAQMFTTGVVSIAPTAPPAGLSALQSQVKSALSMGAGADPQAIAAQLSTAIIQYYVVGGVI